MGPGDLVDDFCQHLGALGRSGQTLRAYRRLLGGYLGHLEAKGVVALEATRAHIGAYQDALVQGGLVPSSVRSHLYVLRVFYVYLCRRELIATPPVIDLPRMRNQPPVHVLSPRQLLRILAQPDVKTPLGVRDRAVLEVLYSTGIRLGELRALEVSAVDFAGGFVRIEHGKGDKGRLVPIGKTALDWTRRYLDEVRPTLTPGRREQTLFLSMRRRPLSSATVEAQIVGKYAKAARVPFRVCTHGLRHAAATHLLRGDGRGRRATLLEVRDLLGHQSCDTTQLYTRIDITDLAREVDARHFRDRRRRARAR
jgi:integrase/recombinase XerD